MVAQPAEIVTQPSGLVLWGSFRCRTAEQICSATSIAPEAGVLGRMTANSSPPIRRHKVAGPEHNILRSFGDLLKTAITARMPIRVVVGLEPVHIHQKQRQRSGFQRAHAAIRLKGTGRICVGWRYASGHQSGQSLESGVGLLQLQFYLLALRDIPRHVEEPDWCAGGGIAHRAKICLDPR